MSFIFELTLGEGVTKSQVRGESQKIVRQMTSGANAKLKSLSLRCASPESKITVYLFLQIVKAFFFFFQAGVCLSQRKRANKMHFKMKAT